MLVGGITFMFHVKIVIVSLFKPLFSIVQNTPRDVWVIRGLICRSHLHPLQAEIAVAILDL